MFRIALLASVILPMAAQAQDLTAVVAAANAAAPTYAPAEYQGVPITYAPGDCWINTGCSLTDAQGNVWSLQTRSDNSAMGMIIENGSPVPALDNGSMGWLISLRLDQNGQVNGQSAKGWGWVNPNAILGANAPTPGSGNDASASGSGSAADTSTPPVCLTAWPHAPAGCPDVNPSTGATTTTASASTTSTDPTGNAATPGNGSVTDSAGNIYTVATFSDAGINDVMINGQPSAPNGESTNTAQITTVDGTMYGQDQNTQQWFSYDPNATAWTPLQDLPASGEAPVPTDRWDTPQTTAQQ